MRHFRPLFAPGEGNFQLVQHHKPKRLFDVNGSQLRRIIYPARYTEDLLFLPLALLLWPLQWLRPRRSRRLFGFKSLLCRYHIFVGEKLVDSPVQGCFVRRITS